MSQQLARLRFTVEQFHRMAETGILAPEARVELIDGDLVEMTPISSRHAACVKRLNRILSQRVGERALVSVQDPIRIGEHSEPQPDVALLEPRDDDYADGHPEPDDILLVVEVADSSIGHDRDVKMPAYAKAGVAEAWIVDLEQEFMEVYRSPAPGGYESVARVDRGDRLTAACVPGLVVEVSEILL